MNHISQDSNRIIGEKIYQLRRANHLTQQELSEQMGISVTFLSEIENGHKSMSVSTLVKLAKSLHVSLDSLVLSETPANAMQKAVVSMMSSLPLEYNESILIIVRELTRLYQEKYKKNEPSE